MRVIGHVRGHTCPLCKRPAFCDDCGCCEECGFACPAVIEPPYPPDPEPMPTCGECGGTPLHERTCSVTIRAAAN